jgi:hypothetical protein
VTVGGIPCNPLEGEDTVDLRFLGVDPESPVDESPTVWLDETSGDLIIQSYEADEATRAKCAEQPAPHHAPGIPAGEAVIRLPARMLQFIPRPDGDQQSATPSP